MDKILHGAVDAGGGINDQVVKVFFQRLEIGGEDTSLPVIQLGKFGNAGCGRYDLQAAWSGHQDFADIFFTREQMLQGVLWLNTEQDVDIGQTGIGIEQANLAAARCQGERQIDRCGTFADTTFTASDSDNPRSVRCPVRRVAAGMLDTDRASPRLRLQ